MDIITFLFHNQIRVVARISVVYIILFQLRHCTKADYIFKCIVLTENICILNKICAYDAMNVEACTRHHLSIFQYAPLRYLDRYNMKNSNK